MVFYSACRLGSRRVRKDRVSDARFALLFRGRAQRSHLWIDGGLSATKVSSVV